MNPSNHIGSTSTNGFDSFGPETTGMRMRPINDSPDHWRRSSLDILAIPWVFTQRQPLSTGDFVREAKRRGVELDLQSLRELYRVGALAPFVEVLSRRVGRSFVLSPDDPHMHSSLMLEFQTAAAKGRVRDPANGPFRRHVAFERPPGASPFWDNGLLYSRYQLLSLPHIKRLWTRGSIRPRAGGRVPRSRRPYPLPNDGAHQLRDLAILLTALEARYLPKLDPAWIRLRNTEMEEWSQYRASFDPVEFASMLGYAPQRALADAESLLWTANSIDPLGREWSSLARRAPYAARDKLGGEALQAMDCREAAEILLLYYEDLAGRGAVEPLPVLPPHAFHPLRERLSDHRQTLDRDLQELGLSPHPRVVLVVEGETEEELIPRILRYADLPVAPELFRVLTLRGVSGDLTKVAALAATPLVGERVNGGWSLIKPPTALFVAMDPEGPYETSEGVTQAREKIIAEIVRVLEAQGVVADPGDLDALVHIRVWKARCFEFEHFDDEELATAIVKVHTGWPNMAHDKVKQDVARVRNANRNIDDVWKKWRPQLSKRDLAKQLWPVLAAKIERPQADPAAPIPPILNVLVEVEKIARRWQYGTFALKGA